MKDGTGRHIPSWRDGYSSGEEILTINGICIHTTFEQHLGLGYRPPALFDFDGRLWRWFGRSDRGAT